MVWHVLLPLPLLSHADSRRSRARLQRAGGAAELAAAFQDDRLGWEPREQAVGLLQDLAAALAQVGFCLRVIAVGLLIAVRTGWGGRCESILPLCCKTWLPRWRRCGFISLETLLGCLLACSAEADCAW